MSELFSKSLSTISSIISVNFFENVSLTVFEEKFLMTLITKARMSLVLTIYNLQKAWSQVT